MLPIDEWHKPKNKPQLTPQELKVLYLLSEGLDHPSVAKELWLSPETIKTHSAHARQKLGAKNTTHAVALALQLELI